MARRVRSSGPLDLRSQAILRAVIEEYVTTAQPVGSHALVERYRIGVSSATVRAVLSELELAGLLTHPHTSAGRVPTEAGYRYYVEAMIDSAPLPPVEQLMIRHQFGQVEFASEHWFRLAATTLASLTRAAGIATPAKPTTAHLRHLDLVAISDRLASLILVLREGSLKQVLVTLDEPTEQAELSSVAAFLNDLLAGLTAADAERVLARLDEADPTVGAPPPRRASASCAACRSSTPTRSRSCSATACSTSWPRPSSPRARSCAACSRHSRTASTSPSSSTASRVRTASASTSAPRTRPRRWRTCRSCSRRTAGPAAPSAWSACSVRPAWPTPRRSARSAS